MLRVGLARVAPSAHGGVSCAAHAASIMWTLAYPCPAHALRWLQYGHQRICCIVYLSRRPRMQCVFPPVATPRRCAHVPCMPASSDAVVLAQVVAFVVLSPWATISYALLERLFDFSHGDAKKGHMCLQVLAVAVGEQCLLSFTQSRRLTPSVRMTNIMHHNHHQHSNLVMIIPLTIFAVIVHDGHRHCRTLPTQYIHTHARARAHTHTHTHTHEHAHTNTHTHTHSHTHTHTHTHTRAHACTHTHTGWFGAASKYSGSQLSGVAHFRSIHRIIGVIVLVSAYMGARVCVCGVVRRQ